MRGTRSIVVGSLALFAGVAPPLAAQQTLVLDNGDRLTGRLARIEGGAWIFHFGHADVPIPAARVASFDAPSRIGVRLADGSVAAATIATQGDSLVLTLDDGSIRRIHPTGLQAVGPAADLDSLIPVEIGLFSPLLRFWRASGSLGFSDKSGNSRARGISTSLEIQRRTPKDRLRLTAGLNREQSRDASGEFEPTVSNYHAALRADIYFTRRLFTFAESRQERDTFQDIALRSNYGGGAGVQLIATPGTDLRVSTSGGARFERFVSDGTETVAVLNTSADLQQELGPATLAWGVSWSPNVEDLDDYQIRSQATLTTTVYKGLGLRLGVLNEFDSRPRPGVDKHDMLITTTIAFSIGR